MKKRLRKKRRLREYREDCFELKFDVSLSVCDDAIGALTDAFIDMIEASGLQYAGGGHRHWSGIVQGPYRGSTTAADRKSVLDWLDRTVGIENANAGPFRDAWYGWS